MKQKIAAFLLVGMLALAAIGLPWAAQRANSATEMLCLSPSFATPMVACKEDGSLITSTASISIAPIGGPLHWKKFIGNNATYSITFASPSQVMVSNYGDQILMVSTDDTTPQEPFRLDASQTIVIPANFLALYLKGESASTTAQVMLVLQDAD